MLLNFCSLASSSSGNSYLIKTEKTAILVDAGISAKKILQGLEQADTKPEEIEGLFLTHEHIDHVKSVKTLLKKLPNMTVYSNIQTAQSLNFEIDMMRHIAFVTGDSFEIADIKVKTFALSHDAIDPVGYSFCVGKKMLSIVTDTGTVTKKIYEGVKGSDFLILEANHDINTLQFCSYPYNVKRRILGKKGHLSNDAAGEMLCSLLLDRLSAEDDYIKPTVLLAHLSKENNFPQMAYQTVKNKLEEQGLYVGKHVDIDIILRDEVSKVYNL